MRFRPTRTFAALTLALGALAAASAGAVRPEAVADSNTLVTPVWKPVGLDRQAVTVMVQLTGDPVTVQQEAAGRKLSRAERDQAKARLKGDQEALRSSIEKLGGTVIAGYQSAYNGVKVRIARDKAEQLATLPGVKAVHPLQIMRPDNVRGVPLIGAPGVWQNLALRGEDIKVAIIDTGIDYTHANFGGPGTVAAYDAAHAAETAPADPALFGPLAPRVKGGVDLVGDSYDADPDSPTYQPVPHPDPNPLDCNGHGSHVAGTAAGSGVTSAGATFTGPYNASTIGDGSGFIIGPGVAPKADLYAVRVFGCNGSTDVTVDAIEWAVDNDMDVINMSLGSAFGTNEDPSAEASTNAAKAGVVVVTSAGNSGASQYITGSPGTADGSIATAANDAFPSIPGVRIVTAPPSGTPLSLLGIDANGYPIPAPIAGPLVVLKDNPATTADEPGFIGSADESLGCSPSAYTYNGIVPGGNQIAVAKRGVCARVARPIFGQQAGAAVVVMANNAAGLPPFEGPISANPDTGVPYTVTIPFVGVAGNYATAGSDSNKLVSSPAGTTATLSAEDFANPNFLGFASFSSGGPRTGDSSLKPDITAPGVSVVSTGVGLGTGSALLSGTSMASPLVAGVAALTRQAHPTWKVQDIKAAITNTGQPSGVLNYRTSRGGTGLVQPAMSTQSQVVARANGGNKFAVSVNFGFAELQENFSKKEAIKLTNNGSLPATFNVAQALPAGSPHSVSFNKSSVTVPANGEAEVVMTLDVPAATAGDSSGFREVAGLIQFTPATPTDNANVTLRVPYYLVPRSRSDVATTIGRLEGTNPSTIATVTNKHGVISGDADFYAWGLEDKQDKGKVSNDIRAVGVQSFPNPSAADPDRQLIVFAINTYDRWSNASTNEFDIPIDVDGDGTVDYFVVGVDQGAVQTGTFNGVMGSFVFSTRSGGASIAFLASAPTNSSTVLLPVRSSQLCRAGEPCLSKTSNPRITYGAVGYDLQNGGVDEVAGTARYNVWSSAISQGGFATVAPGGTDATNVIAIDSAEWALTPAKGLMVVTFDNKSGPDEAQLIEVKVKK